MFCIKCGQALVENDKYCLSCGAPAKTIANKRSWGWPRSIVAKLARIKILVPYIIIGLLVAILIQNLQLYKMAVQNADGVDDCTSQASSATNYASDAADSASEAANYSSEAVDAANEAADYASNCPGNY